MTDPTLIEKTGGIVQGMSGSPLIQNGKLIGAVTHIRICAPENWLLPENPDDYLNEIQQVCEGGDDFAGLLQGVLGK